MKKVISGILAIAMILTIGVSVFANVSKEITDELASFGIMKGDPDGSLRLDDAISRAEMAKIIMATMGFEEIAPVKTSFSDVDSSYWASGYIDAANANGIIDGNGDSTFSPEDNVTNEQVVKMIVCVLGYKQKAELTGGYPFGYMMNAAQIGFMEGLDFVATENATRGDVAIMIHNAIDVPLMVQTSFGADSEYRIMDGKNGIELQTIRNTILNSEEKGGSGGSSSSSVVIPEN